MDTNLIKTEFNDETREYFTNYFLEKPCTPSVMDYLLYNVFDKPFSMASSSFEFDDMNDKDILEMSEMESFIIRVAKKYLHHYHFLSREDDCVRGVIESWIHNHNEDDNEYPVRNAHDLFDIEENENVYTVIFWMSKGGVMEYGYSEDSFEKDREENEENKKYVVPIEKNMVMIVPDYVYYKPYTEQGSGESQQYIMVHLCV